MITELHTRLPVCVLSATLPTGVVTKSRKGTCLAWDTDAEICLWLVCFDETGELVWVPMREIKLRKCWTHNRRR